MFFSKFIPKHFSTRLILITLLSGIIPVIIFSVLISFYGKKFIDETQQAIEAGQSEQWQRSQTVLDQMAENYIRQKAFDVALQIELYLQAHPHLTVVNLQNTPEFREIAIQPVGKDGYTALHDSNNCYNRFHNNRELENTSLSQVKKSLPQFWTIMNKSINGRIAKGYYTWPEPDGTLSEKFMYIVPIKRKTADGIQLSVTATAYKDEFTRSINAARSVSHGTTNLLIKTTNNLLWSLTNTGLIFMGFSIVLVVLLAAWSGYYFSRAIRQLRGATKAVNQGDLNVRVKSSMSGDVGDLISDFNSMIRHLDITTVKKEQLEELVDARTGELTLTNEKLQDEVEERRIAVEALQANEKRMNAILQASPVGIGLVVNREFKWANERMFQLTRYDHESLTNKHLGVLYSDTHEFKRVGKVLYDRLRGAEIAQITTRWRRRDGRVIDCNLRACPLDPQNLELGIIIAASDISKAKHLEEKLQQARKMEAIGTLAGGVAHDLNNILSGLVSYPELLLLEVSEDSPIRAPLITIKKSGEQAAAVVQDLLTMARRSVAIPEVLNINDTITSQLESLEYMQFQKYNPNIEVYTDLDRQLLNVHGSPPHITKAFMNLVNNAAESMPLGGTITIITRNVYLDHKVNGYEVIEPGEYALLSVVDEGTGISEHEMAQIFEPFFTKKAMGRSGSGLGMAVVWGTIKDHKGYVDINSSLSKGTTFSLYFPITRDKITESVVATPIEKFKGNMETVLIVDDSESQREIAQRILEKLNYTVTSVPSGEEAVDYLQENDTDLMLLDMIMDPGIDGLETFKRISKFKPKQKVIIASGFSESDRVKELQQLSGCQYIKKPYTLDRIGTLLKNALHKD